ncbi:hypothetical protein BGZ72_007330 [Mortierella alpina]|nr:hypothetical protein BGZ72_007330 [Mortierella alpina]
MSTNSTEAKAHQNEGEDEAQIATDWDAEDLEVFGLSGKDLNDFEFDDPFDPDTAEEDENASQEKEPSRATLNSLQSGKPIAGVSGIVVGDG